MRARQHLHKSFTRTSCQELSYHERGELRGPGVPPAARFSWPPLLPVWRTQAASGGNPREGPGEEALAAKKIPTLAQQDRGQEEAGQGKGWRRTPGVACLRVQSRPPPSFRAICPPLLALLSQPKATATFKNATSHPFFAIGLFGMGDGCATSHVAYRPHTARLLLSEDRPRCTKE